MFRLWIDMTMLGLEAQQVMLLRSMRLAAGGKTGQREARRMVSEKIAAANRTGRTLAAGGSVETVVKTYRKKVRANRKRLARGSSM